MTERSQKPPQGFTPTSDYSALARGDYSDVENRLLAQIIADLERTQWIPAEDIQEDDDFGPKFFFINLIGARRIGTDLSKWNDRWAARVPDEGGHRSILTHIRRFPKTLNELEKSDG